MLNKEIDNDDIRQTEPTTCFKKLILGHPRSLSQLSFRSPHFAWHVRTLRDRVWIKFPLAQQISVSAHDVHHVSMLIKGSGWHTQSENTESCAGTGSTLQGLCFHARLMDPPAPSRLHGGSDSEQKERADARFLRHLNRREGMKMCMCAATNPACHLCSRWSCRGRDLYNRQLPRNGFVPGAVSAMAPLR